MFSLCLDLGGTKSEGALFDPAGREIGRARGPAGAMSLGVAASAAVIRGIRDQIDGGIDPRQMTLTAGMAGIGLRDRIAELTTELAEFAGCDFVNDGYGMLLAATGGAPGALIAVGTGVSAQRLTTTGDLISLSGWGFPAGDLGSGAWIGLQAATSLNRAIDRAEAGPAMGPELFAALLSAMGGAPAALMEAMTAPRANAFARLAPLVTASADPVARGIMARAGAELALVARALWRDDGPGPVYLTGGIAAAVEGAIRAAAPELDLRPIAADPLAGLSLLARGLAPPERLIPRPGLAIADY